MIKCPSTNILTGTLENPSFIHNLQVYLLLTGFGLIEQLRHSFQHHQLQSKNRMLKPKNHRQLQNFCNQPIKYICNTFCYSKLQYPKHRKNNQKEGKLIRKLKIVFKIYCIMITFCQKCLRSKVQSFLAYIWHICRLIIKQRRLTKKQYKNMDMKEGKLA